LLLGEWQEIVETVLLKQRVSAGEQEAIERGFAGEANTGRDLVDPDADGPEHARASQFIKGPRGQRVRQVELSGPRRERVSLDTEFRQGAKYGKWSEPGSLH
jgi:hypothetical protein